VPDENPSGLGAFDLPLRLPGQYYDKETNLHYNYFRDYDPNIGIYKQSDPIGLAAGPNTYLYVRATPLRYVDPLGLAGCGPDDSWQNYIIPNNPAGFPFEPCCDTHDRCYDNCKGPDKLGCDMHFCGCVFDTCKKYAGYVQTACRRTAQEYCYRVLDSDKAAEQFRKARDKCKGGVCKP
jgi:RHS repeat-associated protein